VIVMWWLQAVAGVILILRMTFVLRQGRSVLGHLIILIGLSMACFLQSRLRDGLFPGYVAPYGKISHARKFVVGRGGEFEELEPGHFYEVTLHGAEIDDNTLRELQPFVCDIPDVYLSLKRTSVTCEGILAFHKIMPHYCIIFSEIPGCERIGP
jgi:hypothetical protein